MGNNLKHWARDYLHLAHTQSQAFLMHQPPKDYLGFVKANKVPIILIPGVLEKWHFLKSVADPLSKKGHPVYVLDHLGYNTSKIEDSAELVHQLIIEKNLRNVVLISHSKGGLVGKHVLAFHNRDKRIRKLITIATPFSGSHLAGLLPSKMFAELTPNSEAIHKLHKKQTVNSRIVSIFGAFDNHIWPQDSCFLKGALNIEVKAYGHHKILASEKVKRIVLKQVNAK